MPKILDYPRASLKSALELAEAIDDLGGACSFDMAAERLGRKVSGAFQALASATVKYGLAESKSQKLTLTNLYKDYKLAYTTEESNQKLRQALLSPPIFQGIYERFAGKEIPVAHFEKLLIREFSIPDDWGSRIASYFIEGAKQCGLLGENNRLIDLVNKIAEAQNQAENSSQENNSPTNTQPSTFHAQVQEKEAITHSKNYVVRVTGPGINSTIEVNEVEDMLIVQAMLKKVEKALQGAE